MSKTVEFCGELRHETDLAYIVFDGAKKIPIPKSQYSEARPISPSDDLNWTFEIPEWLAIKKGIV